MAQLRITGRIALVQSSLLDCCTAVECAVAAHGSVCFVVCTFFLYSCQKWLSPDIWKALSPDGNS